MLEKPDLSETLLTACLQDEYGLQISQLTFLPLGYDPKTVVYRVVSLDGSAYFLKLRKGNFEPITVSLPEYLSRHGLHTIIAPLRTSRHQLFGHFGQYAIILYPFIPGKDGYEHQLTDDQWLALGQTLRNVHEAHLPLELRTDIPTETYDPQWREAVIRFLDLVEKNSFSEPIANSLAVYMHTKRAQISRMVHQAEQLAEFLQLAPADFVLCHSDTHPGNYLVTETGQLYLVDWDTPVFAPRERDLMCIGSGTSGSQPGGREEHLFYQGYGVVVINRPALAYYRYERIIQDIAEFCKRILLSTDGGEDRQESFKYLVSSFSPGHEVQVAFMTDPLTQNNP